ncbi:MULTISPECIES: hypothetical protein [unclassified Pseudomonas]|uniref:hypothetical protein n=1 Tax=unclassified Pseudomonas TaxID=196821 RepID=UPI00244C34EB|nr:MULTISPECIES: hypothetical protein [unclassified Pseudomonas]MDG9924429.1 hypothetical protein [Pseudomonas sp. GD04045]MDH0035231.1 hypothetical protein [Pseudomonas sp. GD04019]
MRLGALLLLGWLYAMNAVADEQVQQHLHELRTRSSLLCSSALLYFNPALEAQDSRALASSYDSLNLLATRVVQLGQPEPVLTQLRDMQRLFKDLERLPRQQAQQYPPLLLRLLRVQREMDVWADQQLAAGGAAATPAQLRQHSLGMARLLLDYQARSYPFVDGEYQGLAQAERQALDQDLQQGLRQLQEADAAQAETLGRVRKGYRFVRSQILANAPRESSGGVEFYLARGIVDLDELAVQIGQVGQ